MEAYFNDLTLARTPTGTIVIRVTLFDANAENVSLAAARELVDQNALRSLPEPICDGPERWHGIGTGCPVRLRVSTHHRSVGLLVMWNGPYAHPAIPERDALMRFPRLLGEKDLLAGGQEEILKQQLEEMLAALG